ncbi:hypothetical protein TKK_0014612 [Trichogramma kaykai]
MYGRKKEAPEKKVTKPRSNSPVPKSFTKDPRKPKPVGKHGEKANATGEEESCVALRTRSRVNSRSNPLVHPGASVAARVDSGLKKKARKTSSTPKAKELEREPQPSTSTAAQYSVTASEDSGNENPPLVDPRYSGLRKDDSSLGENSTEEEEPEAPGSEASTGEAQNEEIGEPNQSLKPAPAIILTPAPTTDEVTNMSSAEDTTEVVATALSEDELLKAAAEIDISQRILESRAYEAEDIPAEKDADITAALERSCISDGTSIDDQTREHLDGLDPYDEVRNTDKVLQDRVERLIRDTQAKVSREQNASTASIDTEERSLREGETLIVSGSNRPLINERDTKDTPMSKSTPMATRSTRTSLPPQKLIDIPEEAETAPVVLNFSQPSVPDFPIFFPIPLEEGPLNKYILEHKPASRAPQSDHSEYGSLGLQIRIARNVIASREALTYGSDNYITFVSQDCEPSTRNLRQLSEMDAIDLRAIKARRPALGQAVVSPFKNNNIILLVVKRHHYDPLTAIHVRAAFKSLRDFMTRNKLYSARVARKGELTDTLSPGLLTEIVRDTFRHTPIKVTICYGQTKIPPEEERRSIIVNLHSSRIGGHKGMNQTYSKIRERYYWNGMRHDIHNFIRKCPDCQEKKLTQSKTRDPLIITDTPLEAFDKVSIDTVGKLRLTPEGNCHLLTMQCNLTKFLIAIPIPNIKASTIADALARHLICQFGAPRAILSDRGTSFLSDLVESVMRIFKVKHLTTSSYRPQSNGALERSHAPLVDFIRTYSKSYDDWDRLAPFATFAYNTSVHSATNFTPFELVYGKMARFSLRIPDEDKLPTYNLYLQDLIIRLGEMKFTAAENQIKQKNESKAQHDRHLKPFNGRVGGYAWILKEPRTGKFDLFYKAPLQIKEILGNNNVILELPTGKQIRKHTSKLKAVPE